VLCWVGREGEESSFFVKKEAKKLLSLRIVLGWDWGARELAKPRIFDH
jgi:hypothetical protein